MTSVQMQHQGAVGTRDGRGAGDHDQYSFGRRPCAAAPYLFTTRQYLRLLILRGRVQDGLAATDDLGPDA